MNNRESFEDWYSKTEQGQARLWQGQNLFIRVDDRYVLTCVHNAWIGWQGAMEYGMGEPMAYGMPNTAITGSGPSMMMVRNHIPSDDQYGGALWVPLYAKPE